MKAAVLLRPVLVTLVWLFVVASASQPVEARCWSTGETCSSLEDCLPFPGPGACWYACPQDCAGELKSVTCASGVCRCTCGLPDQD